LLQHEYAGPNPPDIVEIHSHPPAITETLTQLVNIINPIDSIDEIVLAIADKPSQTFFIHLAEQQGLE
jgi:hypothetical protein